MDEDNVELEALILQTKQNGEETNQILEALVVQGEKDRTVDTNKLLKELIDVSKETAKVTVTLNLV